MRLSLNKTLLLLAGIKFVLPFILHNSYYQLHRDEYLYLAEGHHMAWGYLEVPPMLSVFAWLSNVLGGSMFWVKLWPNLFGVATMILAGRMVIALGGTHFAILLAALPFLLGGYLRLFYLLHPNFLDVFFWTLMAYSLFFYVRAPGNKWLYLFGVAAGLGMMSKYSTAFYAVALLLGLAISRYRKVYLNKQLYVAAIVAFIIFLPNLYWQYTHNFPIVRHMEELQEEQLQFIQPSDFVLSQIVMLLPFVFIWIGGLVFTVLSNEGKQYRIFAWAYAGVISLLIALHGKDYYALGSYPVLFALGGYYMERLSGARFKWLRYAMIAIPVGLCIWAMPLTLPVAKPESLATYYRKAGFESTGALKWEDQAVHPLPQDFADMIGWREMAEKTAKVLHALPPIEQQQTMVYARGYFTAGALNYYGPSLGLPETYSDNASFLFWMPDRYHIKNLLLVGHNMPGKDDVVFQQFEKVTILDSVSMPLFRENGMKFILFENGNDSVNTLIEKSVGGLKSKFMR